MFILKAFIFACAVSASFGGHVSGREGKCEFSNENNPMLGNVYSCKIINSNLHNEHEKFTVTGTHQSKGRKDLSVKFVEISSSNITQLPDQILRKFPNLEYLSANGVGLKTFNPLSNTSDLKDILANNNQLTFLASNIFSISTDQVR